MRYGLQRWIYHRKELAANKDTYEYMLKSSWNFVDDSADYCQTCWRSQNNDSKRIYCALKI